MRRTWRLHIIESLLNLGSLAHPADSRRLLGRIALRRSSGERRVGRLIASRKNLVAMLFFLLSLLCYLKAEERTLTQEQRPREGERRGSGGDMGACNGLFGRGLRRPLVLAEFRSVRARHVWKSFGGRCAGVVPLHSLVAAALAVAGRTPNAPVFHRRRRISRIECVVPDARRGEDHSPCQFRRPGARGGRHGVVLSL